METKIDSNVLCIFSIQSVWTPLCGILGTIQSVRSPLCGILGIIQSVWTPCTCSIHTSLNIFDTIWKNYLVVNWSHHETKKTNIGYLEKELILLKKNVTECISIQLENRNLFHNTIPSNICRMRLKFWGSDQHFESD